MRICSLLLAIGASACQQAGATTALGVPTRAEFAVRWSTADGGPDTADQVATLLARNAASKPSKPNQYQVRFYDVAPPIDAPRGFASILRLREESSRSREWTFQYRGDRALDRFTCPLSPRNQGKSEVDVAFIGAGRTLRAYSYSCTATSADVSMHVAARPKGCAATMQRFPLRTPQLQVDVEEWRLSTGARYLQVSASGADNAEDIDAFRRHVVDVLVTRGIRPATLGMTEIVGDGCLR